ncbi:hypothetical protein ACJIZ3_002352 [Penstemon smallii]|uniref:Uncharacterized protein n=1 Tax=Penstemon smallii TaxID=265156 RepID=A0ABD3U658_9LAMI
MSDDEGSSSTTEEHQQALPEIEARLTDNLILLKVHCVKHKGVIANLLNQVEKLNLIVVNTNVTPFGDVALHITVIAEMEKEFSSTVKEVVAALRTALGP